MKMEHITALINRRVPFVAGGRDPERGLDCWGLVVHVLGYRGRTVREDWAPGSVSEVACLIKDQIECDDWMLADPGPWLVVAMGTKNRIYHVGVSVPGGHILHTTPATGIVMSRRMMLDDQFGRIEFYRHASWD